MSTEGPDPVTVPGPVRQQRVPERGEVLQLCHVHRPLGRFGRDHDCKFWGPALESSDDTGTCDRDGDIPLRGSAPGPPKPRRNRPAWPV